MREAEAESFNDLGQKEILDKERNIIIQEMSRRIGFGGKIRKGSDSLERIRKSVSNAIRRALSNIEKVHPELSRHLKNSLKLGIYLSYNPGEKIKWDT